MRKIKQKQKQSQSTNINIKIGDIRRKRKRPTKSKTQKQSTAVPERIRVVTQLVNAPAAPSSTPNLNTQSKQGDLLELLRKQLQLGEISGVQQLSDVPVRPKEENRPRPSTPPTFSLGGDNFSTPYASTAPFSQFAGAEASSSSSSSIGMGSSLPSGAGLGIQEVADEKVPEQAEELPPKPEDTEELPPGESISVGSTPSLIMDIQSVKKPMYDTGLDFHYKVHGQKVQDRIYLNAKNTAFFYYTQFVNINTILSKTPRELLKLLLREKQIVYDGEEQNQVYWVDVAKNA